MNTKMQIQPHSFPFYIIYGMITWLIFLLGFLFLTQALMFIMALEGIAVLFLFVGIICLGANYLVLRTMFSSPLDLSIEVGSPIQSQHYIIQSVERLARVIIILTSLGFVLSLSTFVFASMTLFATHSMDSVIPLLPVIFIFYLILAIPSFYGLREISQLKYFLKEYQAVKEEIRQKIVLS